MEETIRSVLLQNYPNLEYFIIDGGSTDGSVEIIKKYAPWINHWESQPDRGQTHAINKGFQRASGQLINWVNSDDLLCPNALFRIAQFFEENPDVALVNGGMIYFGKKGEELSQSLVKNPLDYLSTFCYRQPSSFFRKKVLEQIGFLDEVFEITMDRDLYVRIALNYSIQDLRTPISKFRKHTDQKTHQFTATWHHNRLLVFSRLLQSLKVETNLLQSLKKNQLFLPTEKAYPNSRSFSKEEKAQIICVFLLDLARRNYSIRNYETCYQIIKWLKTYLPVHYSPAMEKLRVRSRFLRIQLLGRIKKQYDKLLTKH